MEAEDLKAFANEEWRSARRDMTAGPVPGIILIPPKQGEENLFLAALVSGSLASATVDTIIYPLDTIKTRMQAPQGFYRSGGFSHLFRGILPTVLSAVPGGAVFFGLYEPMKILLVEPNMQGGDVGSSWTLNAIAAVIAATASCAVRTPAAVVTQRLQVGQFSHLSSAISGVAADGGWRAFYAGFSISAARELPFAFVQFPLYEQLKYFVEKSKWRGHVLDGDGEEYLPLSSSEGAACGSIWGAVDAAVTCPLDVIRTRLMLSSKAARDGALATARDLLRQGGVSAFFVGMGPRVGWMSLGGFIFFGAYEQCHHLLHMRRAAHMTDKFGHSNSKYVSEFDAVHSSPNSDTRDVSPRAALIAGGIAGIATDAILHPLDTLKTRAIAGVGDATKSLSLRSLYSGLGVALMPTVPAASVFFCTYEVVKESMVKYWNFDAVSTIPWIVAAGIAEAMSCVVRVPFEQLKMRLQARRDVSISRLVEGRGKFGALRALYRGFGATLALDLPFALIQFPVFERLQRLFQAQAESSNLVVAVSGCLSGALAGAITTPLDVIRTRHVLVHGGSSPKHVISSLHRTSRSIIVGEGIEGLFKGIAPRTFYMGLGGVLYLGTYTAISARLDGKGDTKSSC